MARKPSVYEILRRYPTWNDAMEAATGERLPEEENVRLEGDLIVRVLDGTPVFFDSEMAVIDGQRRG